MSEVLQRISASDGFRHRAETKVFEMSIDWSRLGSKAVKEFCRRGHSHRHFRHVEVSSIHGTSLEQKNMKYL